MKLTEAMLPMERLATRDLVETWLEAHDIHHYTIHEDLSVDVETNVYINRKNYQNIWTGNIPVKFNRAEGDFACGNDYLKTLENAPRNVGGTFTCYGNFLRNFQTFPESIGDALDLRGNPITSFHDIDKYIKYIGSKLRYSLTATHAMPTHLLGLLKIEGLKAINFAGEHFTATEAKAVDIINGHLHRDRDIFTCQNDLIEAGFIEQAKL